MNDIEVLAGQLFLGLVNGSFYALLCLGLSLIFGLLNVINFAHGAYFMLGAFVAWGLHRFAGLSYWAGLAVAPVVVGLVGLAVEKSMLSRLYKLDHLYGWLLTFGLALMLEAACRIAFGAAGKPFAPPEQLRGVSYAGFLMVPNYRLWVLGASLAVCVAVWALVEKTRFGSWLRAGTENAQLVQTFGINVPRLVSLTYAGGVALAGFAGALAAPIYQVSPSMGSTIIVVIFAIVVIGGVGSLSGTILTGLAIGLVEGLAKFIYPEGAHVVIFAIMAAVLLLRPAGLFGKAHA